MTAPAPDSEPSDDTRIEVAVSAHAMDAPVMNEGQSLAVDTDLLDRLVVRIFSAALALQSVAADRTDGTATALTRATDELDAALDSIRAAAFRSRR